MEQAASLPQNSSFQQNNLEGAFLEFRHTHAGIRTDVGGVTDDIPLLIQPDKVAIDRRAKLDRRSDMLREKQADGLQAKQVLHQAAE